MRSPRIIKKLLLRFLRNSFLHRFQMILGKKNCCRKFVGHNFFSCLKSSEMYANNFWPLLRWKGGSAICISFFGISSNYILLKIILKISPLSNSDYQAKLCSAYLLLSFSQLTMYRRHPPSLTFRSGHIYI